MGIRARKRRAETRGDILVSSVVEEAMARDGGVHTDSRRDGRDDGPDVRRDALRRRMGGTATVEAEPRSTRAARRASSSWPARLYIETGKQAKV
jgi:hypothetical protein